MEKWKLIHLCWYYNLTVRLNLRLDWSCFLNFSVCNLCFTFWSAGILCNGASVCLVSSFTGRPENLRKNIWSIILFECSSTGFLLLSIVIFVFLLSGLQGSCVTASHVHVKRPLSQANQIEIYIIRTIFKNKILIWMKQFFVLFCDLPWLSLERCRYTHILVPVIIRVWYPGGRGQEIRNSQKNRVKMERWVQIYTIGFTHRIEDPCHTHTHSTWQ